MLTALLGAGAGVAFAQGGGASPFTPGLPTPSVSTATTPTVPLNVPSTTSTAGSSSFSTSDAVAVAIGALVLIGGISYFIWRDARRRAPSRHAHAAEVAGRAGSKRAPKPRKLSPAERRRRKRGRAR